MSDCIAKGESEEACGPICETYLAGGGEGDEKGGEGDEKGGEGDEKGGGGGGAGEAAMEQCVADCIAKGESEEVCVGACESYLGASEGGEKGGDEGGEKGGDEGGDEADDEGGDEADDEGDEKGDDEGDEKGGGEGDLSYEECVEGCVEKGEPESVCEEACEGFTGTTRKPAITRR